MEVVPLRQRMSRPTAPEDPEQRARDLERLRRPSASTPPPERDGQFAVAVAAAVLLFVATLLRAAFQ